MFRKLRFRITGIVPLLQHNGQLADPSFPISVKIKEISSKRKKVESDREEMAHLEFLGGLYLLDGEPCIPGYVFEASLIGKGGAARKERMGKEAAAALFVQDDFPLEYEGPRDLEELWQDKSFRHQIPVRIGQARIIRTRAIFKDWAANIELEFDDELLDEEQVRRWVEVAGRQVGLMDWRPRFGRFTVEWFD